MGDIRQGNVYWFDFGDPVGRRPCVVIQNNVFNKSQIRTTVVCTITSTLRFKDAPGNVFLKRGEAKLSKDSIVNITDIATVDKDFLTEKIGSLPPEKIKQILEGIHLLVKPTPIEEDE